MKILIVDDSKAMRMIVLRNLRQAGYGDHVMIEAGNGAEALAKVKSEGADLILCDWNMPEMNGIDFLRALRADGFTMPFGFVTSESTPAMKEQAIEAGAQFLLSKPFNAVSFEEAISKVL